jgi:hypothetical protein
MSVKGIQKLLEKALLQDGKMEEGLYQHELEELLEELKTSMVRDNDEFLFAVTENSGDVAMVLVEQWGQVHINEQAREKLKAFWEASYKSNLKKLIPLFARQLNAGELPINGVKTMEGL